MSDAPNKNTLSAHRLSIGYHQGSETRIIASDLNLQLKAGEFVCLLGPNGTGKSTLIRTLAGMQEPIHGQLLYSGTNYHDIPPRRRARQVSVVLTDTSTIGMMDAYTMVSLGRHPYSGWFGALGENDRECIDRALDAVGAQNLAHRQVAELSDGERQKISIARALAQQTEVMLLDEPTAFLDLPRRVELMTILRDLSHEKGLALLLSTHDLDLALRFADRLWVITPQGTLIQGYPEAIAMSGDFAKVFQSEKLDWDPAIGSFRAHPTPCLSVKITGTGAAELWTKRALERLGFGISTPDEVSAFSIHVKDQNHWEIERNGTKQTMHSIDAFIDWVEAEEWTLS